MDIQAGERHTGADRADRRLTGQFGECADGTGRHRDVPRLRDIAERGLGQAVVVDDDDTGAQTDEARRHAHRGHVHIRVQQGFDLDIANCAVVAVVGCGHVSGHREDADGGADSGNATGRDLAQHFLDRDNVVGGNPNIAKGHEVGTGLHECRCAGRNPCPRLLRPDRGRCRGSSRDPGADRGDNRTDPVGAGLFVLAIAHQAADPFAAGDQRGALPRL